MLWDLPMNGLAVGSPYENGLAVGSPYEEKVPQTQGPGPGRRSQVAPLPGALFVNCGVPSHGP